MRRNDTRIEQKILIVEDDSLIQFTLHEAVDGLATVITANNGKEAIAKFEEHQPDVIMMDIGLPDISGIEVCKKLQGKTNCQQFAVIFITANEETEIEAKALDSGGIDFLTKPINLATCRLRVKNHLLRLLREREVELANNDINSLVTSLPIHVSFWSPEWRNVFCNDPQGKWFGKAVDPASTQYLHHIFPDSITAKITEAAEAKQFDQLHDLHLTENNEELFLQFSLSQRSQQKIDQGFLLSLLNVTALKQVERYLRHEKSRIKVTLNSIGDAVIATDEAGLITFMNPIAEHMTGYSFKDSVGQPIENIMKLRDATTLAHSINPIRHALREKRRVAMALNCQLISLSGDVFRVEDSAAPILDDNGDIVGAIIVFHDVSEAIAMSVKLNHMANHDPLTDLPNRILLQDRLDHAFQWSKKNRSKVAILLIDLDNFKFLNDSLGPTKGDEIIKLVARRLTDLVSATDSLARIGGDEFVMVVPNVNDVGAIDSLAYRINQTLGEPLTLDNQTFTLSASIGITFYPDDATSQDDLMRQADVAMYRAKQEGRHRSCYFSTHLEDMLLSRHTMEQEIQAALLENRVELFYQPKLYLKDRRVYGAEALVRIRARDGSLIPPDDFIPLAEETGQILGLGKRIIQLACQDLSQWLSEFPNIALSINVAAGQLAEPDFLEMFLATAQAYQLPPHLLELELTESALMIDSTNSIRVIDALQRGGYQIAIDDFGTGYSSLSYLQKFKVNTLKIDQSFVFTMDTNRSNYDIVKTIISLANAMGLALCAEGIETDKHSDMLVNLNCSVGQGYLFAKPLPKESFLTWLRQQRDVYQLNSVQT